MKTIYLLGAGIAAYFLLGGNNASGGGASGSGGKKATAITGIIQPGPGTIPPDSGSTPPSYNTPIPNYGSITTPFEPSPYLLGLIAQKYETNPPPITKKEVAYEAGTQAMFKGFNYPDMTKTSGGYGYTDQQIYSPTKDIGTGVLNERLNQVIVAPQSYVDSIPAAIPTKKDIVAVPYYSFGVGGIGLNTNSGFTPINTATTTTKKTTTVAATTPKVTMNSTVKNIAPTYTYAKYGGWGG